MLAFTCATNRWRPSRASFLHCQSAFTSTATLARNSDAMTSFVHFILSSQHQSLPLVITPKLLEAPFSALSLLFMHAHFTARNALNLVCPAPSRSFEGFAWRRGTRSPPHSPGARSHEPLVERRAPEDKTTLYNRLSPSDHTTMEHPDSGLGQRKTSFNPEAAAFSPTTVAAQQAKEGTFPTALPGPTVLAVHRRELFTPRENTTEPRIGDSTTGLEREMQRKYLKHKVLAPMAVRLEDLISRGAESEDFRKFFEGQLVRDHGDIPLTVSLDPTIATGQGFTDMPAKGYTFGNPPTNGPCAPLPPFTFSLGPRQPDYTAVDVDELSATLGLPSAKQSVMLQNSPSRSLKSRTSYGVSGARQGKLIDRALAKPLTANTLAHILDNQSESSDDSNAMVRETLHPTSNAESSPREERTILKVVRPPPGFANALPRMVSVEKDTSVEPVNAPPSRTVPLGPSGYTQNQCPMAEAVNPFQQHARRPSSRRQHRRHNRPKRTDQGPEPSAADIYPDDANWTPRTAVQQNSFGPPPQGLQLHRFAQPELQVENPVSWPTPAEVYMADTPKLQTAYLAQQDVVGPPSAVDLSAADNDVHVLLEDLPAPSISTLIHFGALDLLGDDRPLTPNQQDGSRYGMRFYGLGLGDEWELPSVAGSRSYNKVERFRVRPRNHERWGGWEWALQRGWGDE